MTIGIIIVIVLIVFGFVSTINKLSDKNFIKFKKTIQNNHNTRTKEKENENR